MGQKKIQKKIEEWDEKNPTNQSENIFVGIQENTLLIVLKVLFNYELMIWLRQIIFCWK